MQLVVGYMRHLKKSANRMDYIIKII